MTAWEREMILAARRNYATATGRDLDVITSWWRQWMPYRFQPDQAIVSRGECIARGYGACGDAAADIAATADRAGLQALICIEAPPSLPGYAHARVVVGGRTYDPYADRRPAGLPPSCALYLVASDMVHR